MNYAISLYFVDSVAPSLNETRVNQTHTQEPLRATRGKTSGAYIGYGTFQWTTAVRALCVLMLETKISGCGSSDGMIQGGRPSLACSLDESINKGTSWLADMLGCSVSGKLLAKSVILRTNSSLKRPGLVTLRINPRQLLPKDIKIYIDSRELVLEGDLVVLKNKLLSSNEPLLERMAA